MRRRLRRPATWSIVLVAVAVGFLYVGLPQIAGVQDTWGRLSTGDPLWLGAAVLFEAASYAAYMLTFHRLFAPRCPRIGWQESYDISLAGVAATRLLATAGAGGIALTAWALRRSGAQRRALVSGLTTFYVALYAIFMAALSYWPARTVDRTLGRLCLSASRSSRRSSPPGDRGRAHDA